MARVQRSTLSSLAPAPPTGERLVPANRLNPGQRRELWNFINRTDAPVKAFLADPIVSRLIKEDGAVMLFEPELIRAALGEQELRTLSDR